jgi:hypothetical protein
LSVDAHDGQYGMASEQPADDGDGQGLGPNTLIFVVRIWPEGPAARDGRTGWRGHITHVPSGERRHFLALDQLARVIGGYLAARGWRATWGQRLRWWLWRR